MDRWKAVGWAAVGGLLGLAVAVSAEAALSPAANPNFETGVLGKSSRLDARPCAWYAPADDGTNTGYACSAGTLVASNDGDGACGTDADLPEEQLAQAWVDASCGSVSDASTLTCPKGRTADNGSAVPEDDGGSAVAYYYCRAEGNLARAEGGTGLYDVKGGIEEFWIGIMLPLVLIVTSAVVGVAVLRHLKRGAA